MIKRASILVMSMWILVVLVALAVSIANKVMLTMQLAKYQRDSIRAQCLAHAALYRAIALLERDANAYDALTEPWADDKKSFEKITLNDREDQYAAISYRDENNQLCFGVRDEERKININKASLGELEQLFIARGASSDALSLAQLVIGARMSQFQTAQEEHAVFKHAPFSVIEELLPILEYYFKDKERAQRLYLSLQDSVSVSAGRVNINTVSGDVLRIIVYAFAKEKGLQDTSIADRIIQEIISLRESKGYFAAIDEIVIQEESGAGEKLLNDLKDAKLSVRSHIFVIQATGVAGSTKKMITVLYNRDRKENIQWHQN